ncbi:efflux RND transporter periplasmic adaptor subunit [Pontibacter locisalis]|uniref:Efflux RND transporter periplasmic adaptor subunit n=1 Tax=Pontibacter locisalis TaxID=1719035 RepID=A0ABW5INN8_9BACT
MDKCIARLLVLLLFITAACGPQEQTTSPSYRQLTEAVYASGKIYPDNEYIVSTNADGVITSMLVEEGDTVQVGQTLMSIEGDIPDARLESATEAYRRARENYNTDSPVMQELRAGLEAAKTKMQNDSVQYVRYRNLLNANATSKAQYDQRKLAYELSKQEYAARQSNYRNVRNQLYLELKNAESQYKINLKDESNYNIRSNINGLVYDLYKEQGELVRRNEPVALLGDASNVYLRLLVDELDIARVKRGQEVLVKVDLYPDKIFKARVTKVYPRLITADQSFRVDAEFIEEKPEIFYGLNIEANIIVSERARVLTIPKSYLVGQDSVLVKRNGDVEKVKLKKGMENFELVEVLSGLDTNSVIVER